MRARNQPHEKKRKKKKKNRKKEGHEIRHTKGHEIRQKNLRYGTPSAFKGCKIHETRSTESIPIPKVGPKEAHSEFWRRAEGPGLADHLAWLVVDGVLVMQLFF